LKPPPEISHLIIIAHTQLACTGSSGPAQPAWLGEEPADEPQLKALLAPYPSDEMICWPVNTRVGNVRNNDPSLIEPVAAA
jgi:putative SOS response-associated peptidase YedK